MSKERIKNLKSDIELLEAAEKKENEAKAAKFRLSYYLSKKYEEYDDEGQRLKSSELINVLKLKLADEVLNGK